MIHHSRSKSAPVNNGVDLSHSSIELSHITGMQQMSINQRPPHSPEVILNWQFGDAPNHSPRNMNAVAPIASNDDSLSNLNQKQPAEPAHIPHSRSASSMFALDNQFCNGPVLDWDVSIDTISKAIETSRKEKEIASLQPVPFSLSMLRPSQEATNTMEDEDELFLGTLPSAEADTNQEYVGSSASAPGHFGSSAGDEHRRCASFTCFPTMNDILSYEERIQPSFKKMKLLKSNSEAFPADGILPIGSMDAPAPAPIRTAVPVDIPMFPSSYIDENGEVRKSKKSRSLTRSSGFRGVSRCSKDGRWQARIRIGESVRYLGRFLTQEEAAQCYDNAARQYHGSKAILNFKGPGDEHLSQSKKQASIHAKMVKARAQLYAAY